MTPKCGRIDVKYANCLYHTRIGLGKWTYDPTLLSFTLGGAVSGGPQGGIQSFKTPRNPLFGICMLERTFTSGGCLRRQGFPTWFTHVIYAAAALAGDDTPGRQCTEMKSHVTVCQANTCGVPNVVKNVRRIENEMDSHR